MVFVRVVPPFAPTHTERNGPSNAEFDGPFLGGAVWVGRSQDKEEGVKHANTSSHVQKKTRPEKGIISLGYQKEKPLCVRYVELIRGQGAK